MDAAQALGELMELSSQVTPRSCSTQTAPCSPRRPTIRRRAAALTATIQELVLAAAELGTEGRDVTRVEVELDEGALFVVREGGHTVAATTGPNPTSGLVVYDLRTCRRRSHRPSRRSGGARKPKDESPGMRKLIRLAMLVGLAVWAWRTFFGSSGRTSERESRTRTAPQSSSSRARRASSASPRSPARSSAVTPDELGALLVERALLEGDFVLRSGRRSSWYLDKYRFETEPEILRALGDATRRGRRGVRAGRRPARRPGARRGRVGSFGSDGVRSAVHHRAR